MIWQSDYILLLRGSESTSPGSAGDDISLAIAGISPRVRLFGDVQTGGDKSLIGRVDKYIEMRVVSKPFTVKANVDDRLQSYGSLWHLQYTVLSHSYVHIKGAYSTLADSVGAGDSTLPRSGISGDPEAGDPTYDDLLWLSLLPMTCVLDGEVNPSPDFESGTENLSFTLVKYVPE